MLALITVLSSCDKEFLETSPTDSFSSDVMFESTQGGYLALNGVYRFLYSFAVAEGGTGHDNFGVKSFHMTMDLLGNDMVVHSQGYGWFVGHYNYNNHRNELATLPLRSWHLHYQIVNNANIMIASIDGAEGPASDINNIKAQAYALRAYGHFQNVQVFATPYSVNPSAPGIPVYAEPTTEGGPRGTVADVYALIVSDLDAAIALFDNARSQIHRSHINKAVAHGLRARVALAMEDWTTAATHASAAIALAEAQGRQLYAPGQVTAAGFNDVNGSEWMWGAQVNEEQATIFASFYSHMDARFLSYAQLGLQKKITLDLYNSFPETDVRRNLFVAPGDGTGNLVDLNQMKFLVKAIGSWEGDYLFMRLAEMYLIKAEADARAGQSGPAQQALYDLISRRDPSYTQSTNTGQALIDEIMLHRRMELWGEGFAFLDMRRLQKPLDRPTGTGNHNAALAVEINIPANDNKFFFRIPRAEFDANDNISDGEQNP